MRSSSQSIRTPTAAMWFGAATGREKLSCGFKPFTRKVASGSPIRSMPPSRIRRSESPASNNANLMLDEPPLIVRMRGLVGFIDDAGGVKLYPIYRGIDGIESELNLKYALLAMSLNLHFTKAQRRHFAAILVVPGRGMFVICHVQQEIAPHDAQANHAVFKLLCLHFMLIPSAS